MKFLVVMISILAVLFVGCADNKTMNGVEYETYGLINKHEIADECVEYRTSIGNVILGIILIETVVFPVYFFGFSLYEPVALKSGPPCSL